MFLCERKIIVQNDTLKVIIYRSNVYMHTFFRKKYISDVNNLQDISNN